MFANLNFIPHIEEYVIVKKINKGMFWRRKISIRKGGKILFIYELVIVQCSNQI